MRTCGVLTASVLVAEVREPPDVAEAYGDADAGEEEVQLVAPPPTLVLALRLGGDDLRRRGRRGALLGRELDERLFGVNVFLLTPVVHLLGHDGVGGRDAVLVVWADNSTLQQTVHVFMSNISLDSSSSSSRT